MVFQVDSARDQAGPAMLVFPRAPDMAVGCRFKFDSSCEHKNRVWDAEYKGFLVMYLWQQLLGKLHLILKSD